MINLEVRIKRVNWINPAIPPLKLAGCSRDVARARGELPLAVDWKTGTMDTNDDWVVETQIFFIFNPTWGNDPF